MTLNESLCRQARLANARFGHNRNNLPGTRMSARGRAPECLLLFGSTVLSPRVISLTTKAYIVA